MEKPKLLIIINRLVIGGQVFDTFPLANALLQNFDIQVLYGKKEADEIEADYLLEKYPLIIATKINMLQRSINPLKDIVALWKIIKILKTYKPNIIHTHGAKSGMLGRLAGFIVGVKATVHTFHGHLFHSYFSTFYTKVTILVERWLAKKTSAIIALSQTQKTELIHWLGAENSNKIKVINLGIDDNVYPNIGTHRSDLRNHYVIADDTIAIGILGRLVPIKNTPFFCALVKELLQTNINKRFVFFVVGDGEEKASMQSYFIKHQISFFEEEKSEYNNEQVIFTSWVKEMQQVIEGLDLVLITSFNEGTPMSLIEAQFCSKPVIAVNVGGVKDTLIDGETGFLIQSHNVESFIEKIVILSLDNSLKLEMGKNGRAFIQKTFSKQNEIEDMNKLYQSLI